jgi:hypothetical protein
VKREKALAVFEIGDRVQISKVRRTPFGIVITDSEISEIKLTNDKPRKLILELESGFAVELSSWCLHERETRK